jgi:NAD(P)-dependent dehydrogenase (short-subunit alcohol dehydrogenase family)
MSSQVNNASFKLENLFGMKGKGMYSAKFVQILDVYGFCLTIKIVALITGGGSGIGLMATQSLAVNGAKVYIAGRTKEKLDRVVELYGKDISGEIVAIPADVTSKESIQKLVDEISAKESKLDILINNAGISSAKQDTDREDPKELQQELFHNTSKVSDWEDVMRTNVMQLFFVTTAFLPLLSKSTESTPGWSSTVINISSISGIIKASQHHFAYNASKAAAIHLTKMLAHEIADSGVKIRVNNIAPGVFPSEMTAKESDDKQKSSLEKEKYEGKVPAGRPGKDEDMAGAVLFTASNQYLNGQTIVVDGGYVLATGSVN